MVSSPRSCSPTVPGRRAPTTPVLLALLLAACSSGADSPTDDAGFPAAAFSTVHSDSDTLVIEVRTAPKQPPERGTSDVEYRVFDTAGQPKSGLEIAVEPWMPDMGHGASAEPEVSASGAGRYVVTGVDFSMAGRWELRTTIGPAPVDHATVTFQIP